jgi:hypothetical protein
MPAKAASKMLDENGCMENSATGSLGAPQPSSDSKSPNPELNAANKVIPQIAVISPEACDLAIEADGEEPWTSYLQGWRLQTLNVGSASPNCKKWRDLS